MYLLLVEKLESEVKELVIIKCLSTFFLVFPCKSANCVLELPTLLETRESLLPEDDKEKSHQEEVTCDFTRDG